MKSPWKFLRDLASRGTATEQAKSAPEIETKKPEVLPAPVVAAPMASIVEAATPTDTVANESANNRLLETAPLVEDPIGRNAPSRSGRAPSTQPKTVQRRARRTSAKPAAVVEAIEPKEAQVAVRPTPSLSEQVAALDEEIRQLRRQLSEKLRLQNEQLERLLKRFDDS
ncbi:hypothetical protein [Ensifer sp. ENS12]|uniref:hypothetical protein n=1 Tax=Ensifer sp. ENS12 TaxID=2854774 RepID=UPI001C48A657|nr:hypothetical protein [Ensifer sp. ENS12]MBV7518911.1 hypothetical protein [Ensifer sp. ENS12]